ncbi:protein LYRIC-like isoform X1 [Xiphophorus maculatus]|uniref:Metadherin a n=2 Tax=Xiphophorus maculatus TaxID=8083 RepID=M3ZNA1_XIPMA|nr:protein LYRIC-like isoform X1 [Xiphophorus maculatus]
MAGDLRSFALEKAELLSSRLRELVSSGQGLVRAQFGVDLGLKPELYPSWLILSTAAVGLLLPLLLGASWAAFCGGGGGRRVGKKRASQVNQGGEETGKASANNKSVKPEEPKKRNRKKTGDKKTQSNGQPPVVAQEEVKEIVAASKTATQIKAVKQVHEVPPLVQVKKTKKKPKTDVKPVQVLPTSDVKEPDDGAWETKVSNREKRQQRRKDKGSEDSGSPGGDKASKAHVETPAASATYKKKRGNNENQHWRPNTKGDGASGKGNTETLNSSSAWRAEPTVNGEGWSDVPLKATGQAGSVERKKWSCMPPSAQYRSQSDPRPWAQESQAAWSSMDLKMKTMPFSVLQLNSADPLSNSAKMQWANQTIVDDQWSGVKGMAADSSSDWNAPAEHWGNYEEPPIPVVAAVAAAATLQKDQTKVSEDEKDTDDPSGGAAKSKKKKKKKKQAEEDPAADVQTPSAASILSAATKVPQLPALPLNSQNTSISSSQKKSEQTVEPQKPSQKKKVRRET